MHVPTDPVLLAFLYLWLFLPAFAANQGPGFARWILRKAGRGRWNAPISERWLGTGKTWVAYPAAVLAAAAVASVQRMIDGYGYDGFYGSSVVFGALVGFGAVFGDHVKSFVKRRVGIPSGAPWWPFDQVDFVLGVYAVLTPVHGWAVWVSAPIPLAAAMLGHPFVNRLGYRLGLRDVPH